MSSSQSRWFMAGTFFVVLGLITMFGSASLGIAALVIAAVLLLGGMTVGRNPRSTRPRPR